MPARVSVVFRADASTTIGQGHVMRCLTLAEGLRARGKSSAFVCRTHDGHLCDLIAARGFPVRRLAPRATKPDARGYASWLGAESSEDARETVEAIGEWGGSADWLVVDHYAVDESWERIARAAAGRILVIDDLADRRHDCDLLLDQNIVPEMGTRYDGRVSETAGRLLGPRYALLSDAYARLHDRVPARSGPVKRLLIYFGGADANDATGRALKAARSIGVKEMAIDVVISSRHAHRDRIHATTAEAPGNRVHEDLPSLAPLIAAADLAIGASGSTNWERLCLGLPAIVLTLADNQRAIAQGLSARGLVQWLGDEHEVGEAEMRAALAPIIENGVDEAWSTRCFDVVDGRGVSRVCSLMIGATDSAHVRPAGRADVAAVADWGGDAASKLSACLRDLDRCRSYSVDVGDHAVAALVSFGRGDNGWRVELECSPAFREQRAAEMCAAALAQLRENEPGALTLAPVREGAGLRISVCSDAESWINPTVAAMAVAWRDAGHRVTWVHDGTLLPQGDICFFLSYGRIVGTDVLARHANNLVVHASDLPRGRGWSPLTWQILEGRNRIPVTLFEAAAEVDSGVIYRQTHIEFTGAELVDELRTGVADATYELCTHFVSAYPGILASARPQEGEPTFYPRRRAADSRLDIDRGLREQFALLRTVDSDRYPAWCEIDGHRYAIKIEHIKEPE